MGGSVAKAVVFLPLCKIPMTSEKNLIHNVMTIFQMRLQFLYLSYKTNNKKIYLIKISLGQDAYFYNFWVRNQCINLNVHKPNHSSTPSFLLHSESPILSLCSSVKIQLHIQVIKHVVLAQ